MAPLVQVKEYFAELLDLAGSEGPDSNRVQAVELLLGQFEITLEALSETVGPGELEAHRQRRKLADSVAEALQGPSLSTHRDRFSPTPTAFFRAEAPRSRTMTVSNTLAKKRGALCATRPRLDEGLPERPSRDHSPDGGAGTVCA